MAGTARTRTRLANAKVLIGIGCGVLLLAALSPLVLGSGSPPRSSVNKTDSSGTAGAVAGAVNAGTTTTSANSLATTDWLSTHATPAQSVAMATSIATAFWTARNHALAAGDSDAIDAIETGPTRQIDLYDLYLTQCGCHAPTSVESISSLQVFVPQQSAYPLDFLAAVQVGVQSTPELMVLTKASASASWQVALDVASDTADNQIGMPTAPAEAGLPAGAEPAPTSSIGVQAFSDAVQYARLDPNDTPSSSTPFGYSSGAGAMVEALYQPYGEASQVDPPFSYANTVAPQPAAGFWSFDVAGMESGITALSCGAIEDTMTVTSTTGAPIDQEGASEIVINPGQYTKMVVVTAVETCVMHLASGALDDFGNTQGELSASGTPAS